MIWILGVLLPFFFLFLLYMLGPKPEERAFDLRLPELSPHLFEISAEIEAREAETENVRADNEARIIWASVQAEKTPYAVLYLHGFSASQGDGKPVHTQFAEYFGCNLYLPRLQAHGLNSSNPLLDFTANDYMKSAVEAYAVARQLGDKLIIMGTSTGASLALYLAAHFSDIHALLLLSPNVELFDKRASLLNKPWGLQIARLVQGGLYRKTTTQKGSGDAYWDAFYRLEALVQLKHFLKMSMKKEIFQEVTQPVFVGYYYKNKQEQDQTVSVSHIKSMFKELGTSEKYKWLQNFPEAGDHCIASESWSNSWESVRDSCISFAANVLKMQEDK